MQGPVLRDDVAGTGTNRQGSRTSPRPGRVENASGSSTVPEDCAKLRVSRTMTGVWNRSERSNAATIIAKPSAGVDGSSMGISRIVASGRVSWSFCEP